MNAIRENHKPGEGGRGYVLEIKHEKSVWPEEEMMMNLVRRVFMILTGPREGSQHAMQGHRVSARTWSGGRRQD